MMKLVRGLPPGDISWLYVFIFFNSLAFLNIGFASAKITVVDRHNGTSPAEFRDEDAEFGPTLSEKGITGRVVYVNPHSACHQVDPPPDGDENIPWIALIARGDDCDFSTKVINVQRHYQLAIVHNTVGDDSLVLMGGGGKGDEVTIPSVFVGYSDGMQLATEYNYTNEKVLVNVDGNTDTPNYAPYLYPFIIVVGTCFCLMVIFMIARWCRDVRSRRLSRLSKKHLKKIPVKKFKKGDYYDVCAICLDEYEEGDKMRVLPCDHAYHVKCIDPWLTKNKKTCPVCKRRVIPGKDHSSDSDDSDEDGGSYPTEVTPLLGGGGQPSSSRASTFNTDSSAFASSGLPVAGVGEVAVVQPGRAQSPDASSVDSAEGAVGGAVSQQTEIVIEEAVITDEGGDSKVNLGFSDDGAVGTSQTKEMNQVV
ncbi:E3 ubiquitin-protein ligase RNF13-like isoform X2 [Gigantopelta aegis]|uniref:E3 ubiquitin-protein ligase RNF13-like isoform X2 n=1 Tax=Gigantopelta aegis TaxID=1735272 RepID=UPI001B888C1A|nr:E3 ubiquitin-protein ligase RNF13-like isoform X2 [Gigantopelta aegis]